MSLSLVADYQSTSSDSEDESKGSNNDPSSRLVPALEMLNESSRISSSVFSNPYREAENYETSLLEKHVKMTAIKETKSTNPEKVCYKFLKGKCRMEDRCKFLHSRPNERTNDSQDSDSEGQNQNNSKKIKKRSGLKDDLIPPKKFMKTYKSK